jgi:hypothetical protein
MKRTLNGSTSPIRKYCAADLLFRQRRKEFVAGSNRLIVTKQVPKQGSMSGKDQAIGL